MGIAYLHLGQYGLSRAALEEARRRSPEKHDEIETVLAWLGKKASQHNPDGSGHPVIQQHRE